MQDARNDQAGMGLFAFGALALGVAAGLVCISGCAGSDAGPKTTEPEASSAAGAGESVASAGPAASAGVEGDADGLEVPGGRYVEAFDAAREELRRLGFLLERVDAQAGVLTTQALSSAGAAAPWDRVQSGVDQELDDLFHRQTRVVRVEFVSGEGSGDGTSADGAGGAHDLRRLGTPMVMRVQVAYSRLYRPGRRVNTGNILSTTTAEDPSLSEKGLGSYSVELGKDERLARRIVERVGAVLAGGR